MRTLMLLMGLIFLTQAADAACANPTGNAGDMTYSTSANVMAYCDSTNWISMAGGVSLTVNTTGGGATPAGSSADVQFNSSGALAADTGNFTYASGLLKAPNISTTAITASGAGNFGTINSSGLGTLGSLIVTGGATITGQASITTVSTSLIQVGNGNGAACDASLAGGIRYSTTSSTVEYCSGSAWLSLGPSATVVPAVLVTMSANQTIAASTATALNLDTKAFDTNNNYNTSTQKFTPTIPGYYQVNTAVTCASATSVLNACIGYLTKNGVTVMAPVNRAGETGSQWTSAGAIVVYMNGSTDYLQLKGFTEASGGGIIGGSNIGGTYFSAALLTMNSGGSGGTATPAGSTNDVQFNSAGLLAADTGNFTYASSTLSAPSILTGGITATGRASLTTVSTTLVQLISNTTTACTAGLAGGQRYNTTNAVIEFCNGTSWTTVGPSFGASLTAFSAGAGSNQTIANNGTVHFTAVTTNNGGSYNSGTGQFTAPATGLYFFTAAILSNLDKSVGDFLLYKNGASTGVRSYNGMNSAANISAYNQATLAAVLYLVAGDKVDIRNASGSSETVEGSVSRFSGFIINAGSGGSGSATPAGTSNDVQFNSSGALAADTGNFTYGSSTLSAPSILTGGLTATGRASLTTVSSTLVQLISNTTTACTAALAGAQRYNNTSNTIDYCSGSAWLSLGPSATSPVSFLVTKGGTNQTVTANTVTKLTWSTKTYDTNNNFSTATSKYTPTVPGKYLVMFQTQCPDSATNFCDGYIEKNGVTVASSAALASNWATPYTSTIVDMNGTTDYLEAYAKNIAGTSISGQADVSFFGGVLLAPQGGSGGGATPAGSTGDIQFNTAGALDADTGSLYWDKTNHRLGIGTNAPAAALQVSGGLIVSTTGQNSLASASFAVDGRGVSVSSVLHMGGYAISPIGAGGNAILSGTTAVSTSSAGSITFYTGGSQAAAFNSSGFHITGASGSQYAGMSIQSSYTAGVGVSFIDGRPSSGAPDSALFFNHNNDGSSYINFFTQPAGAATDRRIERMRIDANGNVYIGTTSAAPNPGIMMQPSIGSVALGHANGTANGTAYQYFTYNGTIIGSVTQNGTTAVAYNTTSDRRVKENITDTREGLQKLMAIGVKDFSFKADPSHTIVNGFIAQDLDKVYPEAVTTNGDNGEVPLKDKSKIWQVDYGRVTPLIVKAVQDLKHLFDDDHGELEKLQAANDNLAHRVDELQRELEKLKAAR